MLATLEVPDCPLRQEAYRDKEIEQGGEKLVHPAASEVWLW